MRKLATALLMAAAAIANAQHSHTHSVSTIKATIVSPSNHHAGKSAQTVLRLTGKDGKPITPDDLQVAHTEKLHLLIVDDALSDYHHEHPAPAEKPGEYRFEFSPRHGGTYHVWADVVPTASGQQEYAKTQIKVQGAPAKKNPVVNTIAEADGYLFALTTAEPLQAGKGTMVSVKITGRDGKEFAQLEPVMGAFAHMVGFPEKLDSVAHVHPTGREPESASERGGPELQFHVQPEKPGFHKFYLQTQIGGREVYAAFGLDVKEGAQQTSSSSDTPEFICPMHPEVKQSKPGKCPKCGMALVPKDSASQLHAH
ncbi:MAG TPA: heavy metal-binding domain-containing protein [Chthoniobacterales bacterium]|nr:heavy metal-binding domain-containing protein [Chthoniobacterales bacterium]